MTTETPVERQRRELYADERWTEWVARGVEIDRQFKKRAVVAGAIIVVFLFVGLFLVR